ncbi:hypothetical protein DB346_14745 [Verrucomicrobia bacterium LW23]|nr:hypothetical protein DB346_14745 [Verrucomicrobia bacterium LW23]
MTTSMPSQDPGETRPAASREEAPAPEAQGHEEESVLVVIEVVKLYICAIMPIVILFFLPIGEVQPIRRVSIALPMIGLIVALLMAMNARSRGPAWWWWLGGALAAQMVGLFYIFLHSW